MWRSGNNLQGSAPFFYFFYQVYPKEQTQDIDLGNKLLYLLRHLLSPQLTFFFKCVSQTGLELVTLPPLSPSANPVSRCHHHLQLVI